MRTLLIAAVAATALAGAAQAQINAPNPPSLHSSGSLLWPRDDSFAYLRGHGIDKDEATIITESLVPQGGSPSVSMFIVPPTGPVAITAPQSFVSARVPDFSPSSSWDAWRQHQYDCAVAHPSYSPMTDMFVGADGGRQYCQLSLMDSALRF